MCPPRLSLENNEAMNQEKALSKETKMVKVPRPWSTFPRSRSFTRTSRPAAVSCRDPSCTARAVSQKQYAKPRNQTQPRLPEHVIASMSIVLGNTKASLEERDTHIHEMALFFASSISQNAKLKRLRMLLSQVTPEEASWQLWDSILRDTLRFITVRSFDWPHAQHTAHVLLLELRAMCLYEMERTSILIRGSQAAAGCIFGAARAIEQGLSSSVPVIHLGLDLAGNQAKHYMTPAVPCSHNSQNEIVIRTYTNGAKRATDNLRETTRLAATSIRDASTDGIHEIARRMEQEQWIPRLIPHEGHRNVLVAVGTVGIASLGAAAIIGEAVVATTASVAIKSAEVTASVVRYKYGEHAGRVVEDASHTTGNVLRTVAHIAMLETSVLAKSVAKNTVKMQATRIHEGDEDESSTTNDGGTDDLLTALETGNFESHLLKIESQASFGMNNIERTSVSTVQIESEPNGTSAQKKEASASS